MRRGDDMREREILVREVIMPVPTFRRMPTTHEKASRDRGGFGVPFVLILAPIVWALGVWL